eukprot:m.676608 g.676608  ORF g.676608 m.676608 type:complete len:79 (+) comp58564_c1_seq1:231-467(+)
MFLGKSGPRTIFNIAACSGVDIQKYSAFAQESEILLLPGTCLVTESVLDHGNGLHLVQLREIQAAGMIDLVRPSGPIK